MIMLTIMSCHIFFGGGGRGDYIHQYVASVQQYTVTDGDKSCWRRHAIKGNDD